MKEKSNLKDMMVALIQDLKTTEGTDLRYINCKNAGKNDKVRATKTL